MAKAPRTGRVRTPRPGRSEIPFWRLLRLARRLGVYDDHVPAFRQQRARVEFLVHELCHALSLRLTLTLGMDRRIRTVLSRRTRADRAANEALCLAAEFYLLPRLGFEVADLQAMLGQLAWNQNVEDLFLLELPKPAAQRLASRVMLELHRIAYL